VIGIWLVIGTLGYHYFARLSWIDALLNASMILSAWGRWTSCDERRQGLRLDLRHHLGSRAHHGLGHPARTDLPRRAAPLPPREARPGCERSSARALPARLRRRLRDTVRGAADSIDRARLRRRRVWTGDAAHPRASALLVRGERLAAVGSDEEIRALCGPRRR
jgi:hypothetical protein